MSLEKFFERLDSDIECRWKILVYPNITQQQDLEKDSYVIVLHNVIKYLNSQRNDLFFTVLIPYETNLLRFDNVEQRILSLPSYPNSMRAHFDYNEVFNIVDPMNEDYDIVYSHLPEHTNQLVNLFVNTSNTTPKFFGYSHWIEVPENTEYNETLIMQNFSGLLKLEECGVNSIWLKNLILDYAKKNLSEFNVDELNRIIQPHYLGTNPISITPKKKIAKSVIFNHRHNQYTGWKWFEEIIDDIWETRKDFKVYTTIEDPKKEWCVKINAQSRTQYLEELSSMQFGVGCFQKYSAWSISVTDGLSVGVPYLLPNGFCYPEMVGSDYPYLYNKTKDDFKRMFNQMLDMQTFDTNLIKTISDKLGWDDQIPKWFSGWDIFENHPTVKDSNVYEKIVDIISKKHFISKSELIDTLNWGRNIKWTPYRNMLRNDSRIKFRRNGYECYQKC